MTPDELRKLVDTARIGTHWDGCWKSHKDCAILAAADAWEADKLGQALLSASREVLVTDRIMLQARVEAVERELEAAEEMLRDCLPVAIARANEYGQEVDEWSAMLAALAGKEKT